MLVFAASLIALSSGLHGTVVIDPARPVCVAGQSCSAPDPHDVLAFWRGGRRAAVVRTDAHGRYRLKLAPGRYTVTAPRHRGPGRGIAPRRVTVSRGRYVRVNFTLDVGIR